MHFGEKSTANFAIDLLLFADLFCPLPGKLASHSSTERKTVKWPKKLIIKREAKGESRDREKKHRNMFDLKKMACTHVIKGINKQSK